MGLAPSHPKLEENEIKQIKLETGFTKLQIQHLHERFCQLDLDGCGYITWTDLMSISKLASNPIGDKIADQFLTL